MIEWALTELGKDLAKKLAAYAGGKITKGNLNEYETELRNVIHNTIDEFTKVNPIKELPKKIPFYASQTLLDIFLEFRFTKKLGRDLVERALINDERLIAPTEEQLTLFFEIFDKKIAASEKISELNIECNYKAEIFNQTEQLARIQASIDDLRVQLKNEPKGELFSDYEIKLMVRLLAYDSPCKIAAAKGEYESLWVPGDFCDMQWGWERTSQEAELSGKDAGDCQNRLHWILIVKQLKERGYLEEYKPTFYQLTDLGKQKTYELKNGTPI